MKVLFLSYEVAPLYKFGGLGDISAALPKALKNLGVDIRIGMPAYPHMQTPDKLPGTTIPMFYSRSSFYSLPGIIGIPSNKKNKAQSFAFFSQDILEVVRRAGFSPDIIHLNDWHTGLVAFLLKEIRDPFFAKTKTLLTIHNTRHQGKFPFEFLKNSPEINELKDRLGRTNRISVNFLRRSILAADYVSTVSSYFASEIKQHKFGFGVGEAIIKKKDRFVGILNGIDYDQWNSGNDPFIAFPYTIKNVTLGKIQNKTALQKKFNLPIDPSIPLFGMVARISWQKGFDILIPTLDRLLKTISMQVIVLGQEDPIITKSLQKVAQKYPKKLVFINDYNEPYAHYIFAGSDFFLVPSVFEPCGLTQMIAFAYGSIPLTSAVGGLADTVSDGNTGYVFYGHNQRGVKTVIKQALLLWKNKNKLDSMRKNAMTANFSSLKSAKQYLALYKKMVA